MARTREHSLPTRQIYASIREDVYLAAKSRAAELRLPMRRFIEIALANAIEADGAAPMEVWYPEDTSPPQAPSIWDDQYLEAQARQPLGAPLVLSGEEARRVALGAFASPTDFNETSSDTGKSRLDSRMRGQVGDPVQLSDEDAADIAREALLFGMPGGEEASDG